MSTNADTYTWTDLSTSIIAGSLEDLMAIDGDKYQLGMSNAEGCQAQTQGFTVLQLGIPLAPKVQDQYIPRNTQATIAVSNPLKGTYELLDGSTTAATVLDSSPTGILHTPDIAQDETLYVDYSNGICSSPPAPVSIKVFDSLKIFVPNTFTPDGPANTRWHLIVQSPTNKFEVNVYDRWGSAVFHSSDPSMSWDGTVGGHPLSGTFIYIIAGTDYFNRPFVYKGTLMIIR